MSWSTTFWQSSRSNPVYGYPVSRLTHFTVLPFYLITCLAMLSSPFLRTSTLPDARQQRMPVKFLEERRRFERLRNCERIWDDHKQSLREDRLAAFKQRERMWLQEQDRRKKVDERQRAHKVAVAERAGAQRTRARLGLVCYDNLPSNSDKRVNQQFVYDFMFSSAPSTPKPASSRSTSVSHSRPPSPRSPSISHSNLRLPFPVFDDSRSIPFTTVLDSMQGSLFPVSNEDLILRNNSPFASRSSSRTRSQTIRRRERQLLDVLLVELKWTEDERRNRKGKQKTQPRTSFPCRACSITSPPTSPLSPTSSASTSRSGSITRTSSWLSFAGSSSPSTDPITPPTSPTPSVSSSKSGWFKSRTVSSLAAHPKSWIATSNLLNPSLPLLRHSCKPRSRFTPVTPSESPLPLNSPHPIKSSLMTYDGRQSSTSTVGAAKEGAGLLARRVSRFMELAKELHQTYVNMALFSSTEQPGNWETSSGERHISGSGPDPNSNGDNGGSRLRAPGYRVNQCDVTAFLNMSSSEAGSCSGSSSGINTDADTSSPPPPKYIPLRSPPNSNEVRTILPDPLPYTLHFKPIPMTIRSPFRFHALSELHTVYPSVSTDPSPLLQSSSAHNLVLQQSPLTWRIRCVGNPEYVRLKALHNVVGKSGMIWEGRGRDTALGGGRERIVGVAYDGVGRSSLSWEVKGGSQLKS